MGRIAVLPAEVQGQIAAGEVVERPASVVKELVENALDAGARHVEVRLTGGGVDRIVVVDDGDGMDRGDALRAFGRHATSKLAGIDDLAAIATLGFRGEALPSIAAAARVRLVTRTRDAEAGSTVEADGHAARDAGPAGAPTGTTVEVSDLFAATPARRKFLRTAGTEVGHVVDALTRLALARPQTGFRLQSDGRELFDYPPVRELGQRLAQILGAERAAGFVSLEAETGGFRVRGLLGPPRESIASARLLWTYVGFPDPHGAVRWVRDRVLTRAVLDGYESLVVKGRYPAVVLFVHVPPGEMDVNVHPAKLEVRFRRSSAIHQLVSGAIRSRLRSALGADARGGDAEHVAEAPARYESAGAAHASAPPDGLAEGPQASLWQPAATGFRPLRFVGQLFDGYLLCEHEGHALLVDQHAAHERVLFERLRAEHAARGVERDALLVPETITLSRTECAVLAEHAATLEEIGFEGEPFGDDTYLLRTMPRLLRDRDAGALVRALAAELAAGGASEAAARAFDAALATIACHAAVRVGQRLEAGQVDALFASMDAVPVNAHCPHGRPVAVQLRRSAIEALFQR